MQEAHVALQEHLRNASRAAEVAVNLEGSVCIPQVVERAVLKQVAIELVGVVAIVQTKPIGLASSPSTSLLRRLLCAHSSPQRLLVERYAFRRNRPHDVCTDGSVAQRN